MATEEQRKRDAAQKRNARRIRSGQPVERASGLSPEALRNYRQRAAERANARDQGQPTPPPLEPPRVAIRPDLIQQDRDAIQRRYGGPANPPELTTRGGYLPRSDIEYNDDQGNVTYDRQGIFPRYNYKREREEAKLFNRQDFDNGDFIPLTYAPTKTSWPGNGFDHRRTIAAGYSRTKGIIRIKFYTDGSIYDYGTDTPIPPKVAYNFRLTQSPGRAIHAGPGWSGDSLESYGYRRIS